MIFLLIILICCLILTREQLYLKLIITKDGYIARIYNKGIFSTVISTSIYENLRWTRHKYYPNWKLKTLMKSCGYKDRYYIEIKSNSYFDIDILKLDNPNELLDMLPDIKFNYNRNSILSFKKFL